MQRERMNLVLCQGRGGDTAAAEEGEAIKQGLETEG